MTQATNDGRNKRGQEAGTSPVGPRDVRSSTERRGFPDPAGDRGSVGRPAKTDPGTCGTASRLWLGVGAVIARLGGVRVGLIALTHAVIFAVTYWLALGFRLDFNVMTDEDVMTLFWSSFPWIVGLKVAVFYAARQYDGWWRYVTFADLVTLARASVVCLILAAAANYFLLEQKAIPLFGGYQHIPRSVLVLDCLLTIVILGALRSSWRAFREHFWPAFNPNGFRWALLVGTDHAAGLLAHQIQSSTHLRYRVKGLVATNGEKAKRLGQIPIVGSLDHVRQLAELHRVTDVLVISGFLPGARLRTLMEACTQAGLHLRIIPSLQDRLDGDCRIPIREIEINDLLRREPVQLDASAIGNLLAGRTVMVTGAGGSIGSEICRQVLKFHPKAIVLVGRGENRIFTMDRELADEAGSTAIHVCIADIGDAARMRVLFERYRPEVIFHAAAHKHVPLMEGNVGEAIKNNIFGTRCVADLAHQFHAESFVLISTDKAVHPTSVMGVTKQIAERYVHTLSQESSTRFTVVRFGNVLGSAGSVVPIFQEQIRRGGPITITDPRMERYFMTIPEASQLVLQAATMGRGGEIFVLEMGQPVRIVDLARDLVRLSGLPEGAIDVHFTGVRPGEKLYEELYFDEEETLPTSHAKVRAAYHRPYSLGEVRGGINQLERLVDNVSDEVLRQELHGLVPEFKAVSLDADAAEAPSCDDGSAVPAQLGK